MRMVVVTALAVFAAVGGRFALPPDEVNPCGPTGTFVKTVQQGEYTLTECRSHVLETSRSSPPQVAERYRSGGAASALAAAICASSASGEVAARTRSRGSV